ncbi:MAG TPA: RNA polymerase sigma factor [Vicinamibacterales bacterium]|nr:RNA polymerase sigma factor [Vicinamibacterales bacterium]
MDEWPPEATAATDAWLARRMLRGDQAAFDEFFHGHFARVYRFALGRNGGDPVDAEDVAQTTMIKGIRNIHTWRGQATLFTWLCTICRHELSRRARPGRPAPIPLTEDDPDIRDRLAAVAARTVELPDRALERRETARQVQVALDTLPAHYGNVLEWKYLEGVDVAEIAARLRSSPKAAESLLGRARRAFREAFLVLTEGSSRSTGNA